MNIQAHVSARLAFYWCVALGRCMNDAETYHEEIDEELHDNGKLLVISLQNLDEVVFYGLQEWIFPNFNSDTFLYIRL